MSVLINFGYKFKLNDDIKPDGSLILASTLKIHTMDRRKKGKYPHFNDLLFDPQLYLAGLDPNQSGKFCATLASYPWFGINGINKYESDQISQKDWAKQAEKLIVNLWTRDAPDPKKDTKLVKDVIGDCVDYQLQLGCKAIILPSPLTHDPGTDYSDELFWLDSGIEYIQRNGINLPVYATIAIVDSCLRFYDPHQNPVLDLILDSVSAREINGVYLVIEQSNERSETKHISDTRVLWSALHIAHILKDDMNLDVLAQFFGPFGLAIEAAGAKSWATGWYKSLYRLRLADKLGGGYAFPSYWSLKAVVDINLASDNGKLSDLDLLSKSGLLQQIADKSPTSENMLIALSKGTPVKNVLDWEYRVNNITACQNHYLYSIVQAEKDHSKYSGTNRLDYVEEWLTNAVSYKHQIVSVLGPNPKTKLEHVQAWLEAFKLFRLSHKV